MPLITLNHQPFQLTEALLPCLITGAPRAGASYFTVTLIAHLINQGSKVIIFTAYPMARDALLDQIGTEKTVDITSIADHLPTDKSLIIESGNQELRKQILKTLPHLEEYIILVKNFEQYDISLLEQMIDHSKLILSGSLDACSYAQNILQLKWTSTIIFTPTSHLTTPCPPLPQYTGWLTNLEMSGSIQVQL